MTIGLYPTVAEQRRHKLTDAQSMAYDGNMESLVAPARGRPYVRKQQLVDGLLRSFGEVIQTLALRELVRSGGRHRKELACEVLLPRETGLHLHDPWLAFSYAPVLLAQQQRGCEGWLRLGLGVADGLCRQECALERGCVDGVEVRLGVCECLAQGFRLLCTSCVSDRGALLCAVRPTFIPASDLMRSTRRMTMSRSAAHHGWRAASPSSRPMRSSRHFASRASIQLPSSLAHDTTHQVVSRFTMSDLR